jgi:hypothetical protein
MEDRGYGSNGRVSYIQNPVPHTKKPKKPGNKEIPSHPLA